MITLPRITKEMDFLLAARPSRSSLPILSYIALRKDGDDMIMRSTDLENHAVVRFPGVKPDGLMETCFLITRKVPRDENKLETKERRMYWNNIPLGVKEIEEFPTLFSDRIIPQKGGVISIPIRILDAMYRAVPLVSKEEMKPALCGVHVYNKKSTKKAKKFDVIVVEATNGHFLYKEELKISVSKKFSFIMPSKSFVVLKKMIDMSSVETIDLNIKNNYIGFESGNNRIECRIIDEHYPDIDSVIPKLSDMTKIRVDSKQTFETFDYIKDVAPINKSADKIEINGSKVFTSDIEQGLEADFPIDFKMPIRIGYSMGLLHKLLKLMKSVGKISWYVGTPIGASLLIPDDNTGLYLLMPIRLGE